MNETVATVGQSSVNGLAASLLALLIVVALILLLAWVLRRLPGAGGRSHGELRIVSTLAVGMRERVMVIAAGEQQWLIGVTAEQITLLQSLDTTIAEPQPPDFRRWLAAAKRGAAS